MSLESEKGGQMAAFGMLLAFELGGRQIPTSPGRRAVPASLWAVIGVGCF